MNRILARFRSRVAAIGHDLAMIPVAWLGAYWLRFNLESIPDPYLWDALYMLPVVIVVQGAFYWYFGLYRGVWRFASLPDLMRISRAVVMGMAVSAGLIFLLTRLQGMPRSVFPLYGLLLTAFLGGPRLLYRWFKDHKLYTRTGKPVLIVGAGRAGEMLVREMLRAPAHPYEPVGFVDDDLSRHGREIHGVRVLGGCDAIPGLVVQHGVEVILVAMPSATARQMRRVVDLCAGTGVPVRTLPPMDAVVSGRAALQELRAVSIEDLLGRDPVSLDRLALREGIAGKVVLVSGGGGSIGSELCHQIARLGPATLVILDQSEFNLYSVDLKLREQHPELVLRLCLGDVTDKVAVEHAMQMHRPDVVFHAAAYKHVPMLEGQAREAVRNNVLGTRLMALAAHKYGCAGFVLISTDKAVNPANVMGATKRASEMICQGLAQQSSTRFITVRFGNVLGSAGSVVPLFRRQIEAGGPVTVTHPEVTRYFMTIPEACQLILQAAVMGKGGEIFVLNMGEPIMIRYLAEQMIRLSGRVPGEEIQITYTGLRPGEKLYEELFHDQENLMPTAHKQILLARSRRADWPAVAAVLDEFDAACVGYDETRLMALLEGLVPEFKSGNARSMDNVIHLNRVPG
ncbi:MAG TPA: nucleoside-diphosphate sugar epimerase/dehydratase [Gammaproteobacteria bacterium]|nr:nucleoside-diphosphate sugar epimerase/dehydratase [Gammaproteobacteria bacterium]